jgi:hypothetical protein
MTFKFSENAYEYLVRGSVVGANSCVEIYASPLFTDEQLQIFCIAKHEEDISIFRADLSGRGSANTRSEINSNFSGTLTSQTADYIITWVAVSFVAYDEDGEITEHLATAHTWAVPFEEVNFNARFGTALPEPVRDYNGCDLEEAPSEFRSCWVWEFQSIKGLSS